MRVIVCHETYALEADALRRRDGGFHGAAYCNRVRREVHARHARISTDCVGSSRRLGT